MKQKDFDNLTKDKMSKEYAKLLKKAAFSEELKKKNAELSEENNLLIAQAIQEEKIEKEESKTGKKPQDMNEFELADFMTRTTSKKVF